MSLNDPFVRWSDNAQYWCKSSQPLSRILVWYWHDFPPLGKGNFFVIIFFEGPLLFFAYFNRTQTNPIPIGLPRVSIQPWILIKTLINRGWIEEVPGYIPRVDVWTRQISSRCLDIPCTSSRIRHWGTRKEEGVYWADLVCRVSTGSFSGYRIYDSN